MKVIANSTDFMAAIQRIKRQLEHAKSKKFIAASIDVADLEVLVREIEGGE